MSTLSAYGLTPESIRILACAFLAHFIVMLVLWAIGRGHRNDSVLDVYWGFSFVVGVWIAYVLSGDVSDRGKLVLTLVTIWGARLGYHLFARWTRIHSMGGDKRYEDIKTKLSASGNYAIKALFVVYIPMWLAYVLAQINMLLVITTPDQSALNSLDFVFAVIMVAAIVLEATADLQLDAFKANPKNEGKVLDYGVWAWSRHPNYFANCLGFWAIFGISLNVPGLWWSVISPLFMTWLLVGFTGKPWLDEHMKKRRPEYADYIARTSGFIPMPPKRRRQSVGTTQRTDG
jgi:steroid 5-alpha reductase family enzyme